MSTVRLAAVKSDPGREIPMQPASDDIWDKKYRLKTKRGEPVDATIDHTYQRVAKALAERHIKPAGGTHAIVFNDKGEAIAITADGKVIPECQLPKASTDGKAAKDARPADPKAGKLPICPGTTNTTLTGASQVSSISHVGSNCITYVICADGRCRFYNVCW